MGVQIENDQKSSILGENQLFNNLSQFIKAKAAPVVFIDKLVTCRSVASRFIALYRYYRHQRLIKTPMLWCNVVKSKALSHGGVEDP